MAVKDTKMYYGDGADTDDWYEFDPVPIMSLEKTYDRTGDGLRLSPTYRVTLEGKLICLNGGLDELMKKQRALRKAFDADGKYFVIKADNDVIFECFPTITAPIIFTPTRNNWHHTVDYTIQLEFYNEPVDRTVPDTADPLGEDEALVGPVNYIRNASQQWSIEYVDESPYFDETFNSLPQTGQMQLRVTHTISAVGKRRYKKDGSGSVLVTEAWEMAKLWVAGGVLDGESFDPKLGWDDNEDQIAAALALSINMNFDNIDPYNHTRTVNVNEYDGSYSVTETWITINVDNTYPATEDFTVTVNQQLGQDTTIDVQGVIQGLEDRDYGTAANGYLGPDSTRYYNAKQYWDNVQPTDIYNRAIEASNKTEVDVDLNATLFASQVAHSYARGTISYNYTYNERPAHCIGHTDIETETITVTDNAATDVFASQTILGRSTGPVLQDIGTITSPSKELSIELTLKKDTRVNSRCPNAYDETASVHSDVSTYVDQMKTSLEGEYDQVFKTQDVTSWSPQGRRYSRNVAWTYMKCS